MTNTRPLAVRLVALAGTAALALALAMAGCKRSDGNQADTGAVAGLADGNMAAALPPLPTALPMVAGVAPASAIAPLAAALPGRAPARRSRLADPRLGYAYLDRAYGQSAAIGAAPPDYAVRYGDVRPWAWQAADRSREIAEPVPGGYRYYYYQPGADLPYLVRDPSYTYAYDGPALVEVFDAGGRPLPPDPGYAQALYAGRYLARAQALYLASADARESVAASNWAAHRAQIAAARANWAVRQAQDAEWRAYHDAHAAEEDAHWQAERARRAEAGARFAAWQAQAFRGQAPILYAVAEQPPRQLPPPIARAPASAPFAPAMVPIHPPRPRPGVTSTVGFQGYGRVPAQLAGAPSASVPRTFPVVPNRIAVPHAPTRPATPIFDERRHAAPVGDALAEQRVIAHLPAERAMADAHPRHAEGQQQAPDTQAQPRQREMVRQAQVADTPRRSATAVHREMVGHPPRTMPEQVERGRSSPAERPASRSAPPVPPPPTHAPPGPRPEHPRDDHRAPPSERDRGHDHHA